MVLLKIFAGTLLFVASFLLYKIVVHGRALKAARLRGIEYDTNIVKRHRRMAYVDFAVIICIVVLLEFALRVLGIQPVYSAFFFFHLACAVTFLLSCMVAFYATGLRHTIHHRPIVITVVIAYILMSTTGACLLYQL